MAKTNILGVHVDDIGREGLETAIVGCVEGNRKEIFAYANVHAINIAQRNHRFREFLNSARMLYCDGEGVRLGARALGTKPPPRTALTRWIWDLCAQLQERGCSVYLLGGQKEVVASAASRLSSRYPRLQLVGYHDGYFDKSENGTADVVRLINRLAPNVLFVGFGMPEQESWIERNFAGLKVNAIIPCGGMIDYLSGEVQVAPRWLSENGMEWLHRLFQDPTRLWSRYLWGNPAFFFRIFQQRLTGGKET